jgi:hypothetical protein
MFHSVHCFCAKNLILLNEDFIMNAIQQTVPIPSNRRLQLDLPSPDSIPVGQAEMLVVLSPARTDKPPKSIQHFVGCLLERIVNRFSPKSQYT